MKAKKILLNLLAALLTLSFLFGVLPVAYASESSSFLTVEGAAIRTTGKQGLKFVGRLYKNTELQLAEDAEFGILLIPQSMVGSNEQITVSTESVRVVPAQNLTGETAEYYEFNAVLTDIPAESYGTKIIARTYLENNGTYYYSEQLSRSVKDVADAILSDDDATDTEIAVANEVISLYNLVGNDILVHADSIWYANSKLITYPEYPEQIARDYMYSVSVSQSGKSADLVIYNQTEAFFYQNRFDGGDVNRRFCEFAFSGAPVTVHVKVNRDFDTYAVVPTSKGFASTYADGVISVTLTKPEQFVIILDNDVNTALAVFADAPETDAPQKGDTDTVYVEGWNQVTIGSNTNATLENGILTMSKAYTQLYIAPGAVLTARVVTPQDNSNANVSYAIKIFGRGAILDPASLIYHESEHGFDNATSTSEHMVKIGGYSSVVKDIKILDSRRFNLNINRGSCTVQNVKILSTMMTSDGITTTADGGTVKDCFVYCGDNALVTQVGGTDAEGYSFENITIGTTCSAIYPQYHANSTFTDIYVFRADEGLIAMKHGDGDSHTKYITVNNLDALDCVRTPWLFNAEDQGSAEKVLTLNKVLMRYTTGSSNVGNAPASGNKIFYYSGWSSGSNFNFNITDMYVAGKLVTSKSDLNNPSKGSFTFGTPTTTPAVLSGSQFTANYSYLSKVMLGYRQLFLDVKPVQQGDTWYLPYAEIASYLAIAPQNPVTTQIGGVEMISLSNLLASGAVTAASYSDGAIRLTPAINSTVNLFKDNYLLSSNYNPLYYKDKTAYLDASYENGAWVYTAKSVSSQGGIMRMMLDVYKMYGAGTYTVTFDYKASTSSITVGVGVDHNETAKTQSVSGASSTEWKTTTVTFTLNDDPASVDQMALWFKVSSGNTISLKNISLTKAS